MVTAGLTPLYIHLIKIQHSINHGQLVHMSDIHLLMFGSLFVIYPSSLRLSGNITNKLLTSRCISAHIHLLAMVYILHIPTMYMYICVTVYIAHLLLPLVYIYMHVHTCVHVHCITYMYIACTYIHVHCMQCSVCSDSVVTRMAACCDVFKGLC